MKKEGFQYSLISIRMIVLSIFLTVVNPIGITVHADSFDNYVEISNGIGSLEHLTIVEGSVGHGGIQPHFLIDSKSDAFKPLLKFARGLKDQSLTEMQKAKLIRDFIVENVFPDRGKSEKYFELNRQYRNLGKPIPLSLLIECRSGVCRENSFVMHLALTEAGVPNKIVYLRAKEPDIDHGFVLFRSNGKLYISDSFYGAFNAKEVTTVVSNGQITKMNLFPKFHIPKRVQEKWQQPLSSLLKTEQLADLLKSAALRVPDLVETWKFAAEKGIPIYLGGGLVRGLLMWIKNTVEKKGINATFYDPVPSSKELLLLGGSDRDMYVDKKFHAQLREFNSDLSSWDFSPLRAHEDSVLGGGVTIEKILVSPTEIIDPFSSLEDFRQGILSYKDLPSAEIAETFWFKERGNSKIAMILRYLRMSLDLSSLSIPEEIRLSLINEAKSELPTLGERHRSWIEKGLSKLYLSSGARIEVFLKILKDYELLTPLTEKGFALKDDLHFPVDLNELKLLGFSDHEISIAKTFCSQAKGKTLRDLIKVFNGRPPPEAVKSMFIHTTEYDQDRDILNAAAPLMSTAADFITLFTPYKDLGEKYTSFLSNIAQNHLSRFISLNPTGTEARHFMDNVSRFHDFDRQIAASAVRVLKTAEDYVILLKDRGDKKQREVLSTVIMSTLDQFNKLDPTISQIRDIMRSSYTFYDDTVIAKYFASRCKSADDFVKLFRPTSAEDQDSKAAMDAAALSKLDVFVALSPTIEQTHSLMTSVSNSFANDARIAAAVGSKMNNSAEVNRLFTSPYTDARKTKSQTALSAALASLPNLARLKVNDWLEAPSGFLQKDPEFLRLAKTSPFQEELLNALKNIKNPQDNAAEVALLFQFLAIMRPPENSNFADRLLSHAINPLDPMAGIKIMDAAFESGFGLAVLGRLATIPNLANHPDLLKLLIRSLHTAKKENPNLAGAVLADLILQKEGMEGYLYLLAEFEEAKATLPFLKRFATRDHLANNRQTLEFIYSQLVKMARADFEDTIVLFSPLVDRFEGAQKEQVQVILEALAPQKLSLIPIGSYVKINHKYFKLANKVNLIPNILKRIQLAIGSDQIIRKYSLEDQNQNKFEITETRSGKFEIPSTDDLLSVTLANRLPDPSILKQFTVISNPAKFKFSCLRFYTKQLK